MASLYIKSKKQGLCLLTNSFLKNMLRTINLTSCIPYSDSFVTWGSHKQIRITRMPTELIYTFSMAFVSCFFCLVMIISIVCMIYLYTRYTLNQYISSTLYCHIVWHFCKAVNTRKLERAQERTLHAVFNYKTEEYEQLLNWADILSLENRRLQASFEAMIRNSTYVMWTSLSTDIALLLMKGIH